MELLGKYFYFGHQSWKLTTIGDRIGKTPLNNIFRHMISYEPIYLHNIHMNS